MGTTSGQHPLSPPWADSANCRFLLPVACAAGKIKGDEKTAA